MDHPFGLGIAALDDSEVVIHYIYPDSADLSNSPTDIALHITDHSVAHNLLRMLDSMWKHAQPIEMAMRRLTPILKEKVYVKFERQTNTSKYGSFASIPIGTVFLRKC
jgi:hypothetical protein